MLFKWKYLPSDDLFELKSKGNVVYFSDYKNEFSLDKKLLIDNKRRPSKVKDSFTLKVITSNSCNMQCNYCFSKEDRKADRLEKSTIDKVISFLKTLKKPIRIAFTGGGEPTLNFEAIRYFVDNTTNLDCSYSITSNGLFSEKICQYFISNSFHVAISIDGDLSIFKEHQNNCLGEAEFKIVTRNIKNLCQSKQIPEIVGLSVSNISDLKKDRFYLYNVLNFLYGLGLRTANVTINNFDLFQAATELDADCISDNLYECLSFLQEHNDMTMINPFVCVPDIDDYKKVYCATIMGEQKYLVLLPDGNISFCQRNQNKNFVISLEEAIKLNCRLGTKTFLDLVKTCEKQNYKCISCISRNICKSRICPATYADEYLKKNLDVFCDTMIKIRTRLLNRLLEDYIHGR